MRIAALALLALAGCAQHSIKPLDLGPLQIQCAAECKRSCLPEVIPGEVDAHGDPLRKWPRWECENPDDPSCWDEQAEDQGEPLVRIAKTCDRVREECVRCIGNAEQVGAVCGVTKACGQ